MAFTEHTLGPWKVLIDHDEVVTIDAATVAEIESFLADYVGVAMDLFKNIYPTHNWSMTELGIPSPVLRLDMPPATNGFRGTYEVEANTAGLGIDDSMGIGITEQCVNFLEAVGIDDLDWAVCPARDDQRVDHELFMSALAGRGVQVREVDLWDVMGAATRPVWLRAGQEDIDSTFLVDDVLSNCLLLHNDGGGNKGYLSTLLGARTMHEFRTAEQVFEAYPNGFVVKPIASWGTMSMNTFVPEQPFKKPGFSRSRMAREIEGIMSGGCPSDWIVQPFIAPEVVHVEHSPSKRFRIWRLYAVWNGSEYKVAGGHWSQRPSLKVHGASDTESGPLMVSRG